MGVGKYNDDSQGDTGRVSEPAVRYSSGNYGIENFLHISYNSVDSGSFSGNTLDKLLKETGLPVQALAGVLSVSKSKYYDLSKMDQLDTRSVDALADFAILWQKGLEAFDGEQELLREWLSIKNVGLGNVRPMELLSSRLGRRELEKAFARIEYSTYA